MSDNNPNNLKVGDIIMVEEAWEDKTGNYADEQAEIKAISESGELTLDFYAAPPQVREFLKGTDGYMAKDFQAETMSDNLLLTPEEIGNYLEPELGINVEYPYHHGTITTINVRPLIIAQRAKILAELKMIRDGEEYALSFRQAIEAMIQRMEQE